MENGCGFVDPHPLPQFSNSVSGRGPRSQGGCHLLRRLLQQNSRLDFEAALLEDGLAFLGVRALKPNNQRNVDINVLRRLDHTVGHTVASYDATKNIDQDGFNVRVLKDDAETGFDRLRTRAATHVEEVGRLATRNLDDVHRGHGKAGAVHHAAYVSIELDVVETVLARLHFERSFLMDVAQLEQVLMPEARWSPAKTWHLSPRHRLAQSARAG